MKESSVESALVQAAAARGGWALKFVSPGNAGVPDRLVIMPQAECPACKSRAKIAFVEVKRPGQVLRPLQVRQSERLARLGACVTWVDGLEGCETLLEGLQ